MPLGVAVLGFFGAVAANADSGAFAVLIYPSIR